MMNTSPIVDLCLYAVILSSGLPLFLLSAEDRDPRCVPCLFMCVCVLKSTCDLILTILAVLRLINHETEERTAAVSSLLCCSFVFASAYEYVRLRCCSYPKPHQPPPWIFFLIASFFSAMKFFSLIKWHEPAQHVPLCLVLLASVVEYACFGIAYVLLLPTHPRYRGMLIGYCLGSFMIAASAFIFLLVGWRFQGIQPLLLEVALLLIMAVLLLSKLVFQGCRTPPYSAHHHMETPLGHSLQPMHEMIAGDGAQIPVESLGTRRCIALHGSERDNGGMCVIAGEDMLRSNIDEVPEKIETKPVETNDDTIDTEQPQYRSSDSDSDGSAWRSEIRNRFKRERAEKEQNARDEGRRIRQEYSGVCCRCGCTRRFIYAECSAVGCGHRFCTVCIAEPDASL